MLVALCREHTVDREVCADFAKEVDIIQIKKPVCVIDENRGVFTVETNEFCHLLFETIDVVLDCLFRHHGAHIRTSRRVADHSRATADENDGAMSCVLQAFCHYHLHEVTDVETVCSRIETDVERLRTFIKQLFQVFFKNHLFDQTAFAKLVDNVLCHIYILWE